MKKLTILTAAAMAVTISTMPLTANAAEITSSQNGGVKVITMKGSNLSDLMQSLPDNLKNCFPQITLPECNLPGFPGIPERPDCPENKPGTPENPDTPDNPEGSPETPDQPDNGNPDNPGGSPETPDVPDQGTPETPGQPDNGNPGTPDLPESPDDGTPDNPDNTPGTPGNPGTPDTPDTDNPGTEEPDDSVSSFAAQVVHLVNQERAKNGLSPVTMEKNITAAAQVRAVEIQTSFSHTRPDGSSFSTALKEQNVSYRGSGENIAWGQRSPKEVMDGWMNSPGHRANILNEKFTSIGVGYVQNANGTNYWTQLFTY